MTTKSNIAQALGVSRPQVTRWARRGMPVFDTRAAQAWVSSNIRKRHRRNGAVASAPSAAPSAEPVAGDPATRSWRDRRDRADCLIRERELALLEGRSLDAGAVEATWIREVTVVRAKVLALPNRAAARMPPDWRVRVEAVLTELVREVLHEIAGTKEGNGHAGKN